MNRDDIFTKVKATLVELFEVDEDAVTLDAQLYQDLELDSIDAIDLVVHLQKLTGKKIKPEEFKSVRSVADVVEAMSSHRPYRPSLGLETALEEIRSGRGVHYHAESVDACLRLIAEKKVDLSTAVW